MTTHLYCVLPSSQRGAFPAGLAGIAGAPVRSIDVGDLAAWVSDVERSGPVIVEGAKAHDAVVQAALDTGITPMPARYGQRFPTDAACAEAIERQSSAVHSVLETIQGFVEMTIILAPSVKRMVRDLEPVLPEIAAEGAGAGRRYLETLRAREAAAGAVRRALDGLAQRLGDALQRFARRVSVQENQPPYSFRTISHLVAREEVDQYRTAIDEVRPPSDSRFIVVGPRAPYSFSSLSGGSGSIHGMKLAD